jgi:hypothetical protein
MPRIRICIFQYLACDYVIDFSDIGFVLEIPRRWINDSPLDKLAWKLQHLSAHSEKEDDCVQSGVMRLLRDDN